MPVSYQGSAAPAAPPELPKVKEFMTRKVYTLTANMSLYDAIDLFLKHKISGAPVLDESQKLVGVYTEKDCLKELKNRYYFNHPPGIVGDNMAEHPVTVHPEDHLIKVSDIFLYNPFKMIPVLEKNKLVGLVSRRDVLTVMRSYRK
ncbi:MAG: CBS domain-containing protein [Leptospiraceae bacterium]|nr:CBS domain-containing protein [Leptospiraceae bacterium]